VMPRKHLRRSGHAPLCYKVDRRTFSPDGIDVAGNRWLLIWRFFAPTPKSIASRPQQAALMASWRVEQTLRCSMGRRMPETQSPSFLGRINRFRYRQPANFSKSHMKYYRRVRAATKSKPFVGWLLPLPQPSFLKEDTMTAIEESLPNAVYEVFEPSGHDFDI